MSDTQSLWALNKSPPQSFFFSEQLECTDLRDFISKHLSFINLVQGNLLHITIFISNINVILIETKFMNYMFAYEIGNVPVWAVWHPQTGRD